MATQFTLPPDTRAVGQGNPPQDVNGIIDALTAIGTPYSVLNSAYSGGADPTGTSYCDTAFADATSAALAAGQPLLIPGGTYKFQDPIDWRAAGLKVIGAGYKNVNLEQAGTSNTPVVMCAGESQLIHGLRIGYISQQSSASTSAACLQLGDDTAGDCFMSHFSDLLLFQGCYGTQINPDLTATGGFFSCVFSNIAIRGWAQSGIYWYAAAGTGAGNCTGSVLSNIYVNNNPAGSRQTSASYAIDIRYFDDIVFSQLNFENCTINATDWVNLQQVANCVISSLHCEALTLAGASGNAGYFHIGDNTSLVINGMTLKSVTLNGTAQNPVARFFGSNSSVTIRGFWEGPTNAFGGSSSGVHPWADFASETSDTVTVSDVPQSLVTEPSIGASTGDVVNAPGLQPGWANTSGLPLTTQGSQASITSPVSLTTGSETVLAGMTVPAGDPVAGAVYRIKAAGYFTTDSTSGIVTLNLTWGGTSLCQIALSLTASLTGAAWSAEGTVTFVTSTTCNAQLEYKHNTATAGGWSANVNLASNGTSATTVTTSSAEALAIQGTNGATSHVTFVASASVPERVW